MGIESLSYFFVSLIFLLSAIKEEIFRKNLFGPEIYISLKFKMLTSHSEMGSLPPFLHANVPKRVLQENFTLFPIGRLLQK